MSEPRLQPTIPTREYIAGGRVWGSRPQILTQAFDDLTAEMGDQVYERMLNDAQVAANISVYKAAILDCGLNLTSPITDRNADGYDQAAKLVGEVEAQLSDMESSISDVLWSLMDALILGCKVAEEIYDLDETYTGRAQYVLRDLKVKPRSAVGLVVDQFMNVRGISGRSPIQQMDGGLAMFDRRKFLVYSFRPSDGDPRGVSLARPAFTPWDLKMRLWGEYYRYLVQFASPSLVGILGPDARDQVDENTGDAVKAVQWLLNTLLEFANSTALALPNGTDLKILWSTGDGAAFLNAFGLLDRQITTAILSQTRATMEAENGSRADSTTAQDVLGFLIRQTKGNLTRAIERDVLRDLVEFNHGPKFRRLTPRASLGVTEQQDVATLMSAVAALERVNYLDVSQLPGLDIKLGLDARTPEELARRQERAAAPPPTPAAAPTAPDDESETPDDQPAPEEESQK